MYIASLVFFVIVFLSQPHKSSELFSIFCFPLYPSPVLPYLDVWNWCWFTLGLVFKVLWWSQFSFGLIFWILFVDCSRQVKGPSVGFMYVLLCVGFSALLCFAELQMCINFFLSWSQPGYLVGVFSLIIPMQLVRSFVFC